ncbi:MAG: FAD-dependent oxidoreductase [Rubrivivax sp.]|nr:FAD-dependent oxidoreductase [Rubrivivax sp.]
MGPRALKPRRRQLLRAGLAAAAGVGAALLPGCSDRPGGRAALRAREIEARWVGAEHARGHRLRDAATLRSVHEPWPAPARRVGALVLGGGVAGLAAARGFMRQGTDDVHVLEIEDAAGGNARGHTMAGLACPLGAHYLPLPGPEAHEVGQWLHEIGLLRTDAAGRTMPDERHLCHSPQERLHFEGQWVEGLLPPAAPGSPRLAQYRRFAERVAALRGGGRMNGRMSGRLHGRGTVPAFALPSHRAAWSADLAELDGITFAAWLGREGLDDPALRGYLDYCCRDDYGAGPGVVSAWAGLHYFASRHGFSAPGDEHDKDGARDGVFTWPEGNAWLTARLAQPLGAERLHAGQLVLAMREEAGHAAVLSLNVRDGRLQHWQAAVAVCALPLFVARHVAAPAAVGVRAALQQAAAALAYAPWLVANLHLDKPLFDRGGAAPAWDNVLHGSRGLGYVDATHQMLSPVRPGGIVLTAYHALDIAERAALLADDPRPWAERVLSEIEAAHPDLRQRVQRIDLMRYGHAMAVPRPGVQRHPALAALRAVRGRLRFAHSDLAGYSVFEEAFTAGCEAVQPQAPKS